MNEPDTQPGRYQHYKGGMYLAIAKGRLSEHRNIEVMVYVSLSPPPESSPYKLGQVWVRPLTQPLLEGDDCWCDIVEWPDGTKAQRFKRIGD